MIGPGVKTGLDIKIEHPETLGADIVAGCVGACEKYGGPFIIAFMGTATAIVYVDENNTYYGGAIAPGVAISLEALTSKGALLSSVELKAPKKAISTNTNDCIRSGIMFGNACMLDGMIERFYKEIGKECKVIATGGLASSVTKNCAHEIIVDKNIILDGLRAIHKKNTKTL